VKTPLEEKGPKGNQAGDKHPMEKITTFGTNRKKKHEKPTLLFSPPAPGAPKGGKGWGKMKQSPKTKAHWQGKREDSR